MNGGYQTNNSWTIIKLYLKQNVRIVPNKMFWKS